LSENDDKFSLFLEKVFEPSSLDQDLSDVEVKSEDSDAIVLTDGSFTEDVEPDYHSGAVDRSDEEMEYVLLIPKNEPDF
jgi:hypothetical protein